MKLSALFLFLALSVASRCCASVTAGDLLKTCQGVASALNSKGHYDLKHPDDIYFSGQCDGFIAGMLHGIDGQLYHNEDSYFLVTVKWAEVPESMFDIAVALKKHLDATPLDSGKDATDVLTNLLLTNGLLATKPYTFPCPVVKSNARSS